MGLSKQVEKYSYTMIRTHNVRHLICFSLICVLPAGETLSEEVLVEPKLGNYREKIAPFLQAHCVVCHSGDDFEGEVSFDRFDGSANVQENYEFWEKVVRLVVEHQMPPADEGQPTTEEIAELSNAVERELLSFDCTSAKHPGRVTIRRLNKAEYNNTIRDLIGLDLRLADDFPSDDVANGFDNMGDVLSIPPILFEKYLEASATVAERAFSDESAKRRVLPKETDDDEQRVAVARENVRQFATRAFRRPITDDESDRLFEIMRAAFEQGTPREEIFQTVVAAILTNPKFLFRVERDPDPNDADGIRELDGFELASRLSYFLWSSMPDERLFELAKSGELTKKDVLASEAKRMLADPKSRALVDNFAGQWLQLRDVSRLMPDPERFPGIDDDLRAAMRRETETFFDRMIREDRNVLEFLDADYTYVNERLARHYGINDINGETFQKVSLPAGRRGVLTHSSILMLTSNPTRTSPVKRGKWILDNFLAEPPPPPPADVPDLEEGGEVLGSLREQMEQHRANESCAVCHRKMDALGFGLENFDAVGAWRERDGAFQIDASGELPGGVEFDGASQLMQILVQEKKTQFCKCLAGKLLTYALGRGLISYDRCTVNAATTALQENDYRFSALVEAIVTSDPFMMREKRRDQ
jgi:mono/diheme cytochrome c family protein